MEKCDGEISVVQCGWEEEEEEEEEGNGAGVEN
jgi:hypothetical protein